MRTELVTRHRGRLAWLLATVTLVFAATAGSGAAETPSCTSATVTPYSLRLTALTGPEGAELAADVTTAGPCAPVTALKELQIKTYGADGALAGVRALQDVPASGGHASVELGALERGRRIEVLALVQTGVPTRTYFLQGKTTALLRPDLVVAAVDAPAQTLVTRPVDLLAEIAELNGDTGASATVTLMWGPSVVGSTTVTVPAGGRASVAFGNVALNEAVPVGLAVLVTDVAPVETNAANNTRDVTVDVTRHELVRSRLLVDSLGGYGAQLNQHVYAAITAAPVASLPDLEAKVKALEPQLVRIFFNEIQERDPDKLASFIRTVQLAHEAGATINITYQTAANAKLSPALFMGQFAAVLEDLVEARGFTNVRWVTVQNEVNSTIITPAQYNALYRALHAELVNRELRDDIGLMGGDLVENGTAPGSNHLNWFRYMAENMNDILDAYSVHIYWNYWDIPRMEFRLRDVRRIVTEVLPADARKPTYITEFGVRGLRNLPGKTEPPGYWPDGTQLSRTNVAAFQQLWFNVVSAQLGFPGTVKWDAYWGRYDNSPQSYWAIGPAAEGWPLFPTYHAMRLLLQTTQRGWHVLGMEPWAADDWDDTLVDEPEQEITAYAGPNGELTLVGLDTHARELNEASAETPAYSVGGLPPSTPLNLVVWNASANGENSIAGKVTTNAAGVARFAVPLHAAFALTTVPTGCPRRRGRGAGRAPDEPQSPLSRPRPGAGRRCQTGARERARLGGIAARDQPRRPQQGADGRAAAGARGRRRCQRPHLHPERQRRLHVDRSASHGACAAARRRSSRDVGRAGGGRAADVRRAASARRLASVRRRHGAHAGRVPRVEAARRGSARGRGAGHRAGRGEGARQRRVPALPERRAGREPHRGSPREEARRARHRAQLAHGHPTRRDGCRALNVDAQATDERIAVVPYVRGWVRRSPRSTRR
jgi:hypothetical protein